MPRIIMIVVGILALGCTAVAQEPVNQETEEKTFDLKHQTGLRSEEVDDVILETYKLIPERKIEVSLTLGYLALNQVLMEQQDIIYKYTDEYTFFGDVTIEGESAFNPMLRINYNLTNWFAIEPFFGITVSEYTSTIANPEQLSNASSDDEEDVLPEPVESLGEYDAEHRSCISVSIGNNFVLYPHNYGNFGRGHWHPYLIGGFSRTWLSLNSNYMEDSAKMWMLSGGAGLRFVADDMISIRFELMMNHFEVDFTPATSFAELDEGTTKVPVYEYNGLLEKIDDYESKTLNSLSWALGFTVNF